MLNHFLSFQNNLKPNNKETFKGHHPIDKMYLNLDVPYIYMVPFVPFT